MHPYSEPQEISHRQATHPTTLQMSQGIQIPYPTSPTRTILLLPTLTSEPMIGSKKINTIRSYNYYCSLEASQNNIVSSIKRR